MKKALFTGIVFVAALAAALRFAPLPIIRSLPIPVPESIAQYLRPELLPVKMIAKPPPKATHLKAPVPLWRGDPAKQAYLASVARFGPAAARREKIKLNHLNFIAAGDTFIAVIDVYEKDMLIFSPALRFTRRWPMIGSPVARMKTPIALAARDGTVAALDQTGRLAWWNAKGVLKGWLSLRGGDAHDLAILPNGDFLVHQTSPYPYLLAQYARNGRLVRRFAAVPYPDSTLVASVHQAYIAVAPGGRTLLGFIYPYKLLFFNARGYPERAVAIEPDFLVQPPIFHEEKGKKTMLARQSIIYDVNWYKGKWYLLIAPQQARAASLMDVFDDAGRFLERFSINLNVLKMTTLRDNLYMLSYYPKYRIEAFHITLFANN